MLALITGASSGLGLEAARELLKRGYDVIGVARHQGEFEGLKAEFPSRRVEFWSIDLSHKEGIDTLLSKSLTEDIDYFYDNAGFGMIGSCLDDKIEKEMAMVDLNVKACHRLLKVFIKRFDAKGKGHILVTASAAAFAPAPYMAPYYATKAYVYWLCLGYWRELKDRHSKVVLSVLCPGPVATNFEKAGNLKFNLKPMPVKACAAQAVKGSFKGKTVIVPSLKIKALHFLSHLVPKTWITKVIKKSAQ